MKMSPEYVEAQKNMKPGVISSVGFLGDDTRNLVQIIEEDERIMSQLGLDFEKVAAWMKKMMSKAIKGLGETVLIDDKWEATIYEARGFIPCPFKDGIFRKRLVHVRNTVNNAQIDFSELSIHLLEKHHFLQGKGSPFRIEPHVLKQVLE
ncbi:hypothetical protein [Thermotoga profunda]|uniref:hypothetical protein n=1 Tax=Thermotoga profunda TaxID=1508420 RepID=UPI00059784D6|nr:hypothetical protein [Thermotoga profunda]